MLTDTGRAVKRQDKRLFRSVKIKVTAKSAHDSAFDQRLSE